MFLDKGKLGLCSVADFSNTGARVPTSAECTPCYICEGQSSLD